MKINVLKETEIEGLDFKQLPILNISTVEELIESHFGEDEEFETGDLIQVKDSGEKYFVAVSGICKKEPVTPLFLNVAMSKLARTLAKSKKKYDGIYVKPYVSGVEYSGIDLDELVGAILLHTGLEVLIDPKMVSGKNDSVVKKKDKKKDKDKKKKKKEKSII